MTIGAGFEGWIRLFLWVHVLGGAVALGIFLVPLLSKKGGSWHVRSGWVYSLAMTVLCTATLALSPWRLIADPNRTGGSQAFAAFLLFIACFSFSCLWFGVRAVKRKTRRGTEISPANLWPDLLCLSTAFPAMGIGYIYGNKLFLFFPLLGLLTSAQHFRYWGSRPSPGDWWLAHMSGMFTASIATITAFLVTAFPRLAPAMTQSLGAWLWWIPTFVLVPILVVWSRYYRKKFSKQAQRGD